MMLRYYSPGNIDRFTPPDICRTPEEFLKRFGQFLNFGECDIELQPGDATRYCYHVIFTSYDKHLLFISDDGERSYVITKDTDPWAVPEVGNPWTLCLLCDIYQKVLVEDEPKQYYHWERACPIKNGEPIR